ncbi:hypothetical protein ACFCW2_03960 [Qipengyuania sp. DSG2-2]|uniref:hypothetical protein n=1 Tax=Qipengyuania sp. DGS2-2 TaxID=3349631 RepID=UPI0036D3D326
MTRPTILAPLALPAIVLLAGCIPEPADTDPQSSFFAALASHCGKAFAGELVSDDAADADLVGADMVMHVRECSDSEIKVPFHIRGADGEWDRSRTWVFTRTDQGLRLKHDHRHEDGKPDAVTMYGGDTADSGAPRSQSFPVDDESIALFQREGLDASVTNVWTVEVDPAGAEGAGYAYQLQRTVAGGAPEERFFRAEFDLTEEVATPPSPWGFDEAGS